MSEDVFKMNKTGEEKEFIAIDDLCLDEENPRFDVNELEEGGQSGIIAWLIEHEQVLALARDIVAVGPSPLHRICAMRENGRNVVLNGNRRICALKLLRNPDLAPEKERGRFKSAVKSLDTKLPETVECVFFDNRDKAGPWLEREHMGASKGRGLRPWSAMRKNHYKEKGKDALAGTLLTYGVTRGFLTRQERRRGIITTTTRYLSTPDVRKAMGVVRLPGRNELWINIKQEHFDERVRPFIRALVDGDINSRTSGTAMARKEYATKMGGPFPDSGRLANPVRLDTETGEPTQDKRPVKKKRSQHASSDPDKRKHIAKPQSLSWSPDNEQGHLHRLFQELCQVDCKRNPFAGGFLFRAFMETLLIAYHQRVMGKTGTGKQKMDRVVKEVASHIACVDSNGKSKAGAISDMADKNYPVSFYRLGMNIHGVLIPDVVRLFREWDNLLAAVKFMLGELKTKED